MGVGNVRIGNEVAVSSLFRISSAVGIAVIPSVPIARLQRIKKAERNGIIVTITSYATVTAEEIIWYHSILESNGVYSGLS